MLESKQDVPERRAQSQRLIQDLVGLRTEMLTLYSRLAATKPFLDVQEPPVISDDAVPDLLQEFCEILIDYTANAHFRLYRYLEEKMEKRRAVLDLARRIYPRIAESTQFIVDFNDRYDGTDSQSQPRQLEHDLSSLGEELAERIELEDQLIQVLCAPRARLNS
jgi:regulator of sigma D